MKSINCPINQLIKRICCCRRNWISMLVRSPCLWRICTIWSSLSSLGSSINWWRNC